MPSCAGGVLSANLESTGCISTASAYIYIYLGIVASCNHGLSMSRVQRARLLMGFIYMYHTLCCCRLRLAMPHSTVIDLTQISRAQIIHYMYAKMQAKRAFPHAWF